MTYLRRSLALSALVVAVVVGSASAAFGHAALISVEPQPESVLDTAPRRVDLLFSDPIELSLAKFAVYDGSGRQLEIGRPRHPGGEREAVRVALPPLDDGSYIVTWRVVSVDSHPVQASFTFQVGQRATIDDPRGLAERLLAGQEAGVAVGAAYGVVRWALFGGLALLIGGAFFLTVIHPAARRVRRARRIVVAGWWAAVVATILGIGLEGAYGAGRSLLDVFDPGLIGDVLGTRFGKVALARLALLLLAWPLLRGLVSEAPRSERAKSRAWALAAGAIAVALAFTPGLGGHATAGIERGFAVPADALHVLAMAIWLGGLVVLVAVVLRARDGDDLDRALPRFSNVALACIATLAATGVFQTWRQVGSIDALRDTDYGRILLVKLGLVAALVVAAAFSREVVDRRRERADEGDAIPAQTREMVEVGATVRHDAGGWGGGAPSASRDERDDDHGDDAARLRRFVLIEVVLAVAVLAASSLLVNTQPARATDMGPAVFTMSGRGVEVDVIVTPGVRGLNDIHLTVLGANGTLTNVVDLQVQLANPERDIKPITVALRRLGPGHYIVPGFDIPLAGTWQLVAKVVTGPVDQVTLARSFTVR